jgi:hypothetical protein
MAVPMSTPFIGLSIARPAANPPRMHNVRKHPPARVVGRVMAAPCPTKIRLAREIHSLDDCFKARIAAKWVEERVDPNVHKSRVADGPSMLQRSESAVLVA